MAERPRRSTEFVSSLPISVSSVLNAVEDMVWPDTAAVLEGATYVPFACLGKGLAPMAYVICSVVLLAIMTALAEGLRYLRHEWTATAYVAFCLSAVAVMYWLARVIDAHDAREREEDFSRPDRE